MLHVLPVCCSDAIRPSSYGNRPLRSFAFRAISMFFARWRAEALLALTTMAVFSQRVEIRAA